VLVRNAPRPPAGGDDDGGAGRSPAASSSLSADPFGLSVPRICGVWASYSEQVDREEREFCAGLPSATFARWVSAAAQALDGGVPRSLEEKTSALSLSGSLFPFARQALRATRQPPSLSTLREIPRKLLYPDLTQGPQEGQPPSCQIPNEDPQQGHRELSLFGFLPAPTSPADFVPRGLRPRQPLCFTRFLSRVLQRHDRRHQSWAVLLLALLTGASSTQVTESSRSLALPLFREASRTTRQPL
jgi:hypothetical protein